MRRERSFLEPSGWFDRLCYAALVGLIPSVLLRSDASDFSMTILLFWWVVVTYHTCMFLYRTMNVLIRLWIRGVFRK